MDPTANPKSKILEEKAKLFLSCGQDPQFDEPKWANQVKQALSELGFDVFFAPQVQNNRAVVDVIYRELRESDYFVFIDFKRELFVDGAGSPKSFRGSLFSHQEFAVACFLDLPIAAFQEKGVEALRGIVGSVMANAIPFSHRAKIGKQIKEYIAQRLAQKEWSINTRNRLKLTAAPHDGHVDVWTNNWRVSHYHVRVSNLHHRKAATGCYAYIESIVNLKTNENVPLHTCELKWEGSSLQGVRISPNAQRGFDAFIVVHEPNKHLLFRPHTDAVNRIVALPGFSNLEITYVVCSNDFVDARQTFRLSYDGEHEVTVWRECE